MWLQRLGTLNLIRYLYFSDHLWKNDVRLRTDTAINTSRSGQANPHLRGGGAFQGDANVRVGLQNKTSSLLHFTAFWLVTSVINYSSMRMGIKIKKYDGDGTVLSPGRALRRSLLWCRSSGLWGRGRIRPPSRRWASAAASTACWGNEGGSERRRRPGSWPGLSPGTPAANTAETQVHKKVEGQIASSTQLKHSFSSSQWKHTHNSLWYSHIDCSSANKFQISCEKHKKTNAREKKQ